MAKVTTGHPDKYGGKQGLHGKNFPTDMSNDNSARFNPPVKGSKRKGRK